jgi:hypothetical protein
MSKLCECETAGEDTRRYSRETAGEDIRRYSSAGISRILRKQSGSYGHRKRLFSTQAADARIDNL